MRAAALTVAAALALGACASTAPEPSAGPPTLDQKANVPEALDVERRWLGTWFKGTPVHVGQRNDGSVTLDVPREFCFDPGRSNVKAPLAAVLDKVAESLRRVPLAHLALLAAPDDPGGKPALAMQRAAEVHKHLLSRGVPAAQLARPSVATTAEVQLRLESAEAL